MLMLIGRLPETIKKCGDSALGGSLSRCEIGTTGSSKDREVPLTALLGTAGPGDKYLHKLAI